MNSVVASLTYSSLQLPSCRSLPRHRMQIHCTSTGYDRYRVGYTVSGPGCRHSRCSSRTRGSQVVMVASSDEGTVAMVSFEDVDEKDWSFLDELVTKEEHARNIDRVISAAAVEEDSRVLVSVGSEGFVDRLIKSSSCNLLLVVHESLFQLACLIEMHDNIQCWQGELIHVPKKWAPLDVVFLYFLPALPFNLDQILGTLANHCSAGARVVISHPQGKEVLEQQRKQYRDVITSDLPDKTTLQNVAADHNFEMVEFVDDQGLYLAVLKLSGTTN